MNTFRVFSGMVNVRGNFLQDPSNSDRKKIEVCSSIYPIESQGSPSIDSWGTPHESVLIGGRTTDLI